MNRDKERHFRQQLREYVTEHDVMNCTLWGVTISELPGDVLRDVAGTLAYMFGESAENHRKALRGLTEVMLGRKSGAQPHHH